MYQIFYDGLPIYDPRGGDLGLVVRDPDCHLAVGEAGRLDFTVDSDHPHYGDLSRLKGIIELRAEGRPIYKGRILKDSKDFYLSKVIETEGLMACLNDSVIPPFNFPEDFEEDAAYQAAAESGNVVEFFLGWLLQQHNSQVSAAQRILLGDVTIADPNNYISRASSEYLTAMEVLKQKITDSFGGYLLADYSGEVTTLHYYSDLPLTNMQTVEFGENLLDLETLVDAGQTYTAILPVGAEGLTIEGLPDAELTPGYVKSGPIIYSRETEALYGGIRITKMIKWDDVTIDTNLRRKALELLSTDGVKLSQTIEVQAADLADMADADVPRFVVGRYVELRSTPHGFRAAYPLMELDPDILNPGNTNIVMGSTIKSASDLATGNQIANKDRMELLELGFNQQQQTVEGMGETIETKTTEAVKTSEEIILGVVADYVTKTDQEEYKKTVDNQFKLTEDGMAVKFEEVNASIENVNGDVQKTVETLEKHFDFSLEDGLVIRSGPNAMTLTLDNDMIIFKKNGQQFGWWDGVDFHTGNIVIEVNERAQFGIFAMVPRSNRSLSFLKVGG